MKSLALFITLLITFGSQADDSKVPCLKQDGNLGLNVFSNYDCSIIKKVVETPEIKNAHKSKVDEKLAERLAFKIERNIEEMAMLDQYFNQFKLGLTEDESVKRECKAELIANPCKNQVSDKKINVLLKKLNSKEMNLTAKMQKIFTNSFASADVQNNTCPLTAPAGYYTLNAQFDESAANDLKNFLKTQSRGSKDWIEAAYKNFPQLKLIKRATLNDPNFQIEFENYIKDYDNKIPIKAYVLGFFAKKSNQKRLSAGLASICTDLKENIKGYLCNDLTSLAVSENTANYLFVEDEDVEESIDISKAFSCDVENDQDKLNIPNGAERIYNNLVDNVVSQLPKDGNIVKSGVSSFCENLLCKTEKIKKTPSCSQKGVASVEDLKAAYSCNGHIESTEHKNNDMSCTLKVRQWIAYLESKDFEKKKEENIQIAKILGIELENNLVTTKEKKSYLSSFSQNFLGVEGSLLAEGKKVNPITVAEKIREFEERKIEPIPSQNRDVILANNENNKVYNMIKQHKENEALEAQVQTNHQAINTFAQFDKNEEHKQAFIANSIAKFSKTDSSPTSKKDVFQAMKEQDRREEIARMRAELESVMKGMKGTDEDKLETIVDSNLGFANKGVSSADPFRGMGKEERERLDQYRQSLQNWESRLRSREFDLDTRDLSSGTSRAVASENEKRYEGQGQKGREESSESLNSGGSGGGGSSGGIKLSESKSGSNTVNGEQANAETQKVALANEGEALVTAESLATLEKSTLKKLGIGQRDSFIIKVKLLEKIYDVPVKSFTHNGKAMFVPMLTKENRDLAKLLLESPLFADYRNYQLERERSYAR